MLSFAKPDQYYQVMRTSFLTVSVSEHRAGIPYSRLGLGYCVGAPVHPEPGCCLALFQTKTHTGDDVRYFGFIAGCYHPSDYAQ